MNKPRIRLAPQRGHQARSRWSNRPRPRHFRVGSRDRWLRNVSRRLQSWMSRIPLPGPRRHLDTPPTTINYLYGTVEQVRAAGFTPVMPPGRTSARIIVLDDLLEGDPKP